MRLILGDDQAIFLDALSTVLTQRGYEVGAVARSPEEMIAHVRHKRPDACLIDCKVAVDEGVQTIRRVIDASQATTVVVLSADPDAESAELAIEAGASGYLHQSRGVEVLVSALERMSDGEHVVDLPAAAPARRPRRASHADTLVATLTGRERECLGLLVAGLDTTAMMKRMGVSRTTVRTHLQAVLTKLGVHSRLEAASFAVRHRLVDAWSEPGQTAPAAPTNRALAVSDAGREPAARGPATAGGDLRRAAAHAVALRPRLAPGRRPGPAWLREPAWPGAAGLAASG